jgi:hypothetical protein
MALALSLRWLLLILAFVTFCRSAISAQTGFDITPVAHLGAPVIAPATLMNASLPILSDTGKVLFRGDGGLFLTSHEEHNVVAAPGDVTPDGRMIAAIGDASVNARGQVAFAASLRPSGSALFMFSEGTVTTIAEHPAGSAPVTPPTSSPGIPVPPPTLPLRSPSVDSRGRIAFIDTSRILLYVDGAVSELVTLDHPALIPGGLGFAFSSVHLNDAGAVVFATTRLGPSNSVVPVGVYLIADGEVRVIAHSGTVAPDGSTFVNAGSPSLNARGDVVFLVNSGPFSGPSGIFVSSDGTLTQIARNGDVVGDYILSGVRPAGIDGQGQVAFTAIVGLPLASPAAFLFSAGLVRPLVVPGDHTTEGDVVRSVSTLSLNTQGQSAFEDSGGPFDRVYRLTDEGISRVAGETDTVAATPRVVHASTSAISRVGRPLFVAWIFPGMGGIFDVNGALRVGIGDAVPGGDVITNIAGLSSNDVGTIAFTAQLRGGVGILLSHEDRTLIEVVRNGSPMPGGGTFSLTPDPPSVNAAGQVAFAAQAGIFLASNGGIAPVVRVGDPAPGGGQFTALRNPSLNDSGQVAFIGSVSSPPLLSGDVFLASADGVLAVVHTGDPAPGGGTFSGFSAPHVNAAGQVAFRASSAPFPPPAGGVFVFSRHHGIRSVVLTGDSAPGGGTFANIGSSITFDAHGRVAFQGVFSSPFDNGVFLISDGNLEAIARSGDPAPGGDTFTTVADPRLSTDGGMLFTAGTPSTGSGVFVARRLAQ